MKFIVNNYKRTEEIIYDISKKGKIKPNHTVRMGRKATDLLMEMAGLHKMNDTFKNNLTKRIKDE